MKRIVLILCSVLSLALTQRTYALSPGSGSLYYIHNDASGTPQAATDESGKVVWKAHTDPFGGTTVDEDPDGDGIKFEMNIRRPGQYYDKETGLHYNYSRHYNPKTGRYLTSDPIGLAGGHNTYAYVANNPYRYNDPYGLASWPIHGPVRDEVAQRLKDSVPNNTSPIPGKTREETIELLANEIADRITNQEAIACKTSAQRRKEVGERLLKELKDDHPGYPWEQWQPHFEAVWK